MARHRDHKLELLSSTALGAGLSHDDLALLGSLAEVVDAVDGVVLHRSGRQDPWTWYVVSGTVAVDDGGGARLMGPNSWVEASVGSAVCLGPTTLLCLGRRELASLRSSAVGRSLSEVVVNVG